MSEETFVASPSIFRVSSKHNSRKQFNLHLFLVNAKIIAIEIAGAVVFFVWLFKTLIHELGW
jgi:nitrate reductase NapE component